MPMHEKVQNLYSGKVYHNYKIQIKAAVNGNSGAAEGFPSQQLALHADSDIFSVRSNPVFFLLQWHVKDPSHSAISAGGRLHLKMHTPDPTQLEWADYATV